MNEMNEMVERVALALCGDDNPANILSIHRVRARAAIAAMREPTAEMVHACPAYRDYDSKARDYRSMIDAALSDQPPQATITEGIPGIDNPH